MSTYTLRSLTKRTSQHSISGSGCCIIFPQKPLSNEWFVRYTNQMQKPEAKFTTRFKNWLYANSCSGHVGAAYEIKVTDKLSVPFTAVSPHQVASLLAVSNQEFVFKIPDAGWQNPFDLFTLRKAPAYIILAFKVNRKYRVWRIHVNMWVNIQKQCEQKGRKSVTQEILVEFFLEDYCEIIAEF